MGFFTCFVWGASNSGSWHMVSTRVYVHVYYRAALIGWSEILGVDLLSREALGSVVMGGTALFFWLWLVVKLFRLDDGRGRFAGSVFEDLSTCHAYIQRTLA